MISFKTWKRIFTCIIVLIMTPLTLGLIIVQRIIMYQKGYTETEGMVNLWMYWVPGFCCAIIGSLIIRWIEKVDTKKNDPVSRDLGGKR